MVSEAWAPGKLFIAGEHAVVDPGEPAVLVAVDRGIHVRVTPKANESDTAHSPHVSAAMSAIEELRASRGIAAAHYALTVTSELDDEQGRKFGLGSSGAVTVAVISALNDFYQLNLNEYERFQLALLATIEISPQASGGDLAASTYRGWIHYTSPDRVSLRAVRTQHGIAAALHGDGWKSCSITPIAPPANLHLLVGWTGTPASTDKIVQRVQTQRQAATEKHAEFLAQSRRIVTAIVHALTQNDPVTLPLIREARELLRQLGNQNEVEIETPQLQVLCDIAEQHGAAAKPSGAGGGDCGIVLTETASAVTPIIEEWSAHGILNLNLTVQPRKGVEHVR